MVDLFVGFVECVCCFGLGELVRLVICIVWGCGFGVAWFVDGFCFRGLCLEMPLGVLFCVLG